MPLFLRTPCRQYLGCCGLSSNDRVVESIAINLRHRYRSGNSTFRPCRLQGRRNRLPDHGHIQFFGRMVRCIRRPAFRPRGYPTRIRMPTAKRPGDKAQPRICPRNLARQARRSALTASVALLAAALIGMPAPASAQESRGISLEIEAGPIWQTRNDVQVPNDPTATRFSLRNLTGSGPWPAARIYVSWHLNQRHELRALFAPLTIVETAALAAPVEFAGASYSAGEPTEGTYTFNSYRVTYRYRFHQGTVWSWWVGFTAKIRDATIELRQGSTSSRKTDLGFVPLLHLAADRQLSPNWSLRFDADALAGGPGRAEDIALKAAYDIGRWTLSAGYRTVEGGADVDAVYAFAWLHYAVVSAAVRF